MNRKISVIGLGYVGLPVAVAFGKKAKVIGFDVNETRLTELRNGKDSTREVELADLLEANIHFTSNLDDLRQADFHIVAVPTPINEAKQPDLHHLLAATKTVGSILKSGDIVVYESTVYPGCTEENCAPILEKQSGLKYITTTNHQKTEGFFLGYSPERINPGDKEHTFTTINKVVSASTPEALLILADTYSSVVRADIYQASSIKVAEAAKVIENTQRDLNIAFVNELAMIFNRIGIDTNEVLEAAATKWNFLPFHPGLVGGHCIGVDPYYLTYLAERNGYHPQVILAGRHLNDNMGSFVAQQVVKTFDSAGIRVVGVKVTVLGLTFKEDCPDLRNSQVPKIISKLKSYGCEVSVHDPLIDPQEAIAQYNLDPLCEESDIQPAHAIVLAVAHKLYLKWTLKKWESLLLPNGILVDLKNIIPANSLKQKGFTVWRL